MAELNSLKMWACYYHHAMGFNITHIVPEKNILRDQDLNIKKNPFKSSTNNRETYGYYRQRAEELDTFDWHGAKGLGTVAGFNGLRALDFDGTKDIDFIKSVLVILGLQENYEWVVESGSKNGFHIIFYCDNFTYAGYKRRLKRYFPNRTYSDKFKCIDFIWFNHLILPPSLHKTGNQYSFCFAEYPFSKPSIVEKHKLSSALFALCYEHGGFNVIKSNIKTSVYYDIPIIDDCIIICQSEHDEYLKSTDGMLSNEGIEFQENEVSYYRETFASLDNVYKKETYKVGIIQLTEFLKIEFTEKNIFEIACGNGYWTKKLSTFTKSILATDINIECIEESRKRVVEKNVAFERQDVLDIRIDNKFDGLFGGFIVSHIKRSKLKDFFLSINRAVKKDGTVILFDNRLVSANNMDVQYTSENNDTYQQRTTPSGENFWILKNFFELTELREILKDVSYDLEFIKLEYFWALKYKVKECMGLLDEPPF